MRETFGRLVQQAKDSVIDDNTTSSNTLTNTELLLKRQINNSVSEIGSLLSNYKNQPLARTMTTVADQIYYAYPPGLNQVITSTMTVGSVAYPLEVVHSQAEWDQIQVVDYASSTIPKFIFPRQADFGVYPTPKSTYSVTLNGFYEPIPMTQDDYTTGTISISQNTRTVTGVGTVFTASMVGRWLSAANTLGEPTGNWYKITAFTSATVITLQSFFEEVSITSNGFIIGESPELPTELHQFIPLHTASTYMLTRRRDSSKAREFMNWAMTGNPANDRRDTSVKQGIMGVVNKYRLMGRGATQLIRQKKHRYSRFQETWTTTLTES